MRYVIGVDIGTQSTKALLVDALGHIVAQHSVGYQPDTPRPLWAEQWPQVWLEAVTTSIAACMTQARQQGIAADAVQGLCISSLYGGSGIAVDQAMQPLHPCLIWMDRRATAQVQWVRQRLDVARLEAITGNGVDSYHGFTKMLWIRDNQPDVWTSTHFFLPPNAFVIQRLTGEVAVDHSSAGNIGGVYDLTQRQWSAEALAMLGIPASLMPPRLVESHEVVGGLLPELAKILGLAAGTPVVAGGVDAAVATFAAGATGQGRHVAMIGTSMCWGYIDRQADASRGLVAMPHVYRGREQLYVFGGAITAGASVSWFRDQFCQAELLQAEASGDDAHHLLEAAAREIPAGADGLLFLPYLMGERSPIWDAAASGAFLGLSLYHRRAHLYRAVLEGVAFALRHNIECGALPADQRDDKLVVVGGAARSDLWMQIIADITGMPVVTIAQDVEAAMGAALLAAFGTGLIDADQVQRGWVDLQARASPQPTAQALYDRRFALYRQLYPTLKNTMHALREDTTA
jgi:xylulokinase